MSHSDNSHGENKCDFCCFRHKCDRKCCCFDHKFDSCCSPFQVRLAGLQGNLSFQLFRLKGCRVTINYECAGNPESVTGKICSVGTDFVSILTENSQPHNKKVVTILIQRICDIEWHNINCSPCKKCHSCDHCDSYEYDDED